MTAPELVEALRTAICDAVECTPYWVAHKPETHQDPYENAAHAVLAALTEAGNVEWGRQWVVGDDTGVETRRSRQSALNQIHTRGGALVSRLVLPWTAAAE